MRNALGALMVSFRNFEVAQLTAEEIVAMGMFSTFTEGAVRALLTHVTEGTDTTEGLASYPEAYSVQILRHELVSLRNLSLPTMSRLVAMTWREMVDLTREAGGDPERSLNPEVPPEGFEGFTLPMFAIEGGEEQQQQEQPEP